MCVCFFIYILILVFCDIATFLELARVAIVAISMLFPNLIKLVSKQIITFHIRAIVYLKNF